MSVYDTLDKDRANLQATFGDSAEWTCTPADGSGDFDAEVCFLDDRQEPDQYNDARDEVRMGRLAVVPSNYQTTPDDRDVWTDPDGVAWAVKAIDTRSSFLWRFDIQAVNRRKQGRGRRMER